MNIFLAVGQPKYWPLQQALTESDHTVTWLGAQYVAIPKLPKQNGIYICDPGAATTANVAYIKTVAATLEIPMILHIKHATTRKQWEAANLDVMIYDPEKYTILEALEQITQH